MSDAAGPGPDPPAAVIFDLGGVVLEWDPTPAYAAVLPPDQVADFLTKIDFYAWNHSHDAGRLFADGEADLLARFPDDSEAIAAYRRNFPLTLTGMVRGTSAIIAELQRAGVRLIALTNWSAETFPSALDRFGILRRFAGIVVSGTERLAKPDAGIFRLACDRYGLDPARTVFVDDVPANVAAAQSVGLAAVRFTDAATLRSDLAARGLLGPQDQVAGPVFHLAVAADWPAAAQSGDYPWSTRGVGYEAEGYVHCSFADQLPAVRAGCYADLADEELIVLRLDPDRVAGLVVVEDLGVGQAFPHLYAPLSAELVSTADPYVGEA